MARFRDLLADGKLVRIFSAGRLSGTVTIDLFGFMGGFDGLWLDQEHVGLTFHDVQIATAAARANGFDNFVRMAPLDYSLATQNLEAGAGGLMAAQIESAEHAEQFVTWSKFAPRGRRGMNTSGRDAHYTIKPPAEFAAEANRDHLTLIQIETLGALNDADKIAAIDGVDLLFVGPSDLSQALGILGQFDHKKLWEAITSVAEACRKHGKHWGTVPAGPAFAQRCQDLGCRMLSCAADVRAMRMGIEAAKNDYAQYFG